MTPRAVKFWLATLVVLFILAAVVEAPPADGDDTLVCMEDEVAWTVDYRTVGAVEDPGGVSRVCMHMDAIEDAAFLAGSQDGYAKGRSDGFYEGYYAAYDDEYGDGYDDGYADATREDQAWHSQQPAIACAVVVVIHRTYTNWPN